MLCKKNLSYLENAFRRRPLAPWTCSRPGSNRISNFAAILPFQICSLKEKLQAYQPSHWPLTHFWGGLSKNSDPGLASNFSHWAPEWDIEGPKCDKLMLGGTLTAPATAVHQAHRMEWDQLNQTHSKISQGVDNLKETGLHLFFGFRKSRLVAPIFGVALPEISLAHAKLLVGVVGINCRFHSLPGPCKGFVCNIRDPIREKRSGRTPPFAYYFRRSLPNNPVLAWRRPRYFLRFQSRRWALRWDGRRTRGRSSPAQPESYGTKPGYLFC